MNNDVIAAAVSMGAAFMAFVLLLTLSSLIFNSLPRDTHTKEQHP